MAGHIRKLKNNKFRIEYMKNGIKYSKNITASTTKEAEKIMAQLITAVETNTYQANTKIRFVDFSQIWLDNHARPNLSPTTTTNYINMLNNRVLKELGPYKLSDITKLHIQNFIRKLKDDGLSSSTQKKFLNLISSILNYAIEMDYLKYNVSEKIKIKRDSTEEKVEMQIYNHEEIELLYKALNLEENKELVDMTLITLYTGLRRGELMGLMAKDVDFENQTLTISRNRVSVRGIPTIKDTKNHKKRTFLITTKTLDIFKRLCKDKKKDDLLFPIHPDTFSSQFKRFLKRNNLKDIRVYDLRHTNASMLHSEGVDYATIAARIGNLPSTTANFYIHKVTEKDKEAKDKLETIF